MAEKLEPGWYWVKWTPEKRWTICRVFASPRKETVWEEGVGVTIRQPAIIGPRLTPPEGE